jgi:hypothetical protein
MDIAPRSKPQKVLCFESTGLVFKLLRAEMNKRSPQVAQKLGLPLQQATKLKNN